MSEIKIGDRIKIYGSNYYKKGLNYFFDGDVGIVYCISDDKKHIWANIEKWLKNNDEETLKFHIKQCEVVND